MPPLKIKLSLSSASIADASPLTITAGPARGATGEVEHGEVAGHQPPSSNSSSFNPVPTAPASAVSSRAGTSSSTPKKTAENMRSKSTTPKAAKPAKPKGRIGRPPKNRPSTSSSAPVRPSAIPPHVYDAGPSTPLSTPPASRHTALPPSPFFPFPTTPSPGPESHTSQPSTPSALGVGGIGEVKEEPMDVDEEDGEASPDPLSTPLPQDELQETPAFPSPGTSAKKVVRHRKPLRELMGKIMIELRRRDEYALFSEPVNLEDFPSYLEIIGGEDKMMDLSTMQSKVDNGEYRHIDEVEADLRMLVTAAQTFNPAGTVPHRSAGNVLFYGLKQIDRARPLVRTPSPSPTRDSATPWRSNSADADPDSHSAEAKIDIPPERRIPEEMLAFPPNSLPARAVAWNLTGGKRVYIKRELRARERFAGKWRHWDLDGTRTLAEMDDIQEVLAPAQAKQPGMVTDWSGLRKDSGWWDWPGVGGPFGQAPVAFTKYPVRPVLRTKQLDKQWGRSSEVERERIVLAQRREINPADDDGEVLGEHLRPTVPRSTQKDQAALGKNPAKGPAYVNTYAGRSAGSWLRDMQDGDVRGEAYRSSVKRFLDGAIKGATMPVTIAGAAVKTKLEPEGGPPSSPPPDQTEQGLARLQDFVDNEYHGGVLSSSIDIATQRALASFAQLQSPASSCDTATTSSTDPLHMPRADLQRMARTAHARSSMRNILRPINALDISPFIKNAEEFSLAGKHGGLTQGLAWTGAELERLVQLRMLEPQEVKGEGKGPEAPNEEPSRQGPFSPSPNTKARTQLAAVAASATAASSPLSTAPPSPPPRSSVSTAETALDELRLELLALCKWFPLSGLKPLRKELADRVLPANVRALLTAPETYN